MDLFKSSANNSEYNNSAVAVIDGCRYSSIECDKTNLNFLCDNSGLLDYKAFASCCKACSESCKARQRVGINAHGYFCASIIASRKIQDACLGRIRLGTISGIVPPPRIAIYAIGCPCGHIGVSSVSDGIQEAIVQKVDVISMSLAKLLPSRFCDELDDGWGMATLDAFKANVLVVEAAGNYGEHGLRSIQRTPPWCLTVGSCTPKTKFKSRIELETNASFGDLKDIEGYAISMFPSSRSSNGFLPVRKKGNICNTQCIMYLKGNEFVIEPQSDIEEYASPVPLINISKETSKTLSFYLDSVAAGNGLLYAFVHSSVREEVDGAPFVSYFSGRGPCCFYKDIMKPDLCFPGEHVAAFWPDDEPIGGIGNSYFASYNVLSGTSFATPRVAAGLAAIKAENKFSVSATISAAITTADKMHGKDMHAFEFAYGAGVFNMEKAKRPGLVYEETAENFENFYFTRLVGDDSCCNLNLPYFSATFPTRGDKWECKFVRKVKNVEKGRSTYTAVVRVHATTLDVPVQEIRFTVVPNRLIFEDIDHEQQFSLDVNLPCTNSPAYSFGVVSGSLVWAKDCETPDDQKIIVDCPIILSSDYVPDCV